MKLSKIYANDSKFKPIIFNEELNVIYGNVESQIDNGTGRVQEHNLGKTSLVYLIDFLLLKKVSKTNFFGKYGGYFSDWVFYLEIMLNDGKFLTIKRAIHPNTKISFKEHFSKNQDYTKETSWDYENLLLNAKSKDDNPKSILEDKYLRFNVSPEFDYRSFLPYLLRTQNDYSQVFLLSESYSHKSRKPLLFDLLGFEPSLLKRKYDLDDEAKDESKQITKLKKEGASDEVYKIKAAIEVKTIERDELKKKLDDFNFYQKEQKINFDLVKKVETKISELNKEQYSLDYSIEQIHKSLDSKNTPTLQVSDIEQLFKEVKIYFPDSLAKDYKEVLNFSSQITKERSKYLKDELEELLRRKNKVNRRLEELNEVRSQSLALLQEKDTFLKYKKYQEELIQLENEIFHYNKSLEGAKTIENLEFSLSNTKDKIKDLSVDIKKEIDEDSLEYKAIRQIFQNIYKTTFEYTALLIVEPNTVGNVNFETTVLNQSQNLTGKADGYTSTKVLCASFVLSILIHYSSSSFYRFAYHDGIMESWGDNHKVHFINLMREYCKKNNIQYVFSLIKSDVPSGFQLKANEIVRTLSKDDYLFGFEF
ncbi:DUF2326 domain-containing protein [Labilibaculum antarcticum]|uniref:DUF2326 domain-containing protein n=1 Tax=Labilibaculum antarcticum TaxID=1717717 RepID=A0A1Y1CIQ0_9BACT|nr:DUF2326 domain-containing protein [Labilibaculum antarcticum]BAX80237.1 hypothetical protein ALGA_1877 [Labilibaculum antarcticum]